MLDQLLPPLKRHQLAAIAASGEFDPHWYLQRYADVEMLGVDPLWHYVWLGAELGRDPSPAFSGSAYQTRYPDVAASGLNPFFHYLTSGRSEGRHAAPADCPEYPAGSSQYVQYRIDRVARIGSDEDWLVFVAFSPDGRLSDCQRYQLSWYRAGGFRIILVVNSGDFANPVNPGVTAEHCDVQVVRENVGFDFGAWRHALELIGGLERARSVSFTNDSILPIAPLGEAARFRQALLHDPAGVVFLTDNSEVRPHSQSYFFRLNCDALRGSALSILTNTPVYDRKEELIQAVEIHLRDSFQLAGQTTSTLFRIPAPHGNPTIHHWEALLDAGMPFIKVQLVTAGILEIDDERLLSRLEADVHRCLKDHVVARQVEPRPTRSRNRPLAPAMVGVSLLNEHGAQQAYNLPPEQNATIAVPLSGADKITSPLPSIAAVIHGFYVDVGLAILDELAGLNLPMRVIVTTDAPDKVRQFNEHLAARSLDGEAVLCPNRGRDVAPFLIEGARMIGDAEVVLHLHTKKSLHNDAYAGWSSFLRANLIGSREIVLSILEILQKTPVGLVYSDHFPAVVGLRNWGYDYHHASALLGRLGIRATAEAPLEFPTSTMFWARREALDPLFRAGLTYMDFEEEAGQIDGTLAHAIERSLLYVAQHAGFEYAKVTSFEEASEPNSTLLRLSVGDLGYALGRPQRYLVGETTVRSDFCNAVPEVYPVPVARSHSNKRRLTAILPTMKPSKIYGGITTALRTIQDLVDALPKDVALRLLVTSDTVDAASVEEACRRLHRTMTVAMPDDDVQGDTIISLAEQQNIPLSIRQGEMFAATAWWTADLAFRMIDRHEDLYGRRTRLLYIIQDFEPGFYDWSNKYALAEATYQRGDDTLAIINSEELASYMLPRYRFASAYCLPYEPHPRLAELVKPTEPEQLILAYGRPGVSRNCFDILREGLRIWQASNPADNAQYRIVFAGEEIGKEALAGLTNATCAGKMTLEDYADLLSEAAIGVSLMVSPHPSYPPLEMAYAGCMTITNRYEGKDLSRRADNILSVSALTPAAIANSLDEAASRVIYGQKKKLRRIKHLDCSLSTPNYKEIAAWLMDEPACRSSMVVQTAATSSRVGAGVSPKRTHGSDPATQSADKRA